MNEEENDNSNDNEGALQFLILLILMPIIWILNLIRKLKNKFKGR